MANDIMAPERKAEILAEAYATVLRADVAEPDEAREAEDDPFRPERREW